VGMAAETKAGDKRMNPRDKPIVPVRFPPSLAAAARVLADRDGMTLSAWVRRLIDQEIGRREGKCPTCKQPVTDDMSGRH
jgi:hypothetical protein